MKVFFSSFSLLFKTFVGNKLKDSLYMMLLLSYIHFVISLFHYYAIILFYCSYFVSLIEESVSTVVNGRIGAYFKCSRAFENASAASTGSPNT